MSCRRLGRVAHPGWLLGLAVVGVTLAAVPAAAAADPYAMLLQDHVRPATIGGVTLNAVDYPALKADPLLEAALANAAAAHPETLSEASRLAFWINAYNLLAIKAVVDQYPTRSIRDGGGLFTPIWKKKIARVAGQPRSLDEVEHEILRRQFREPRIHFAIVCASLSCPNLRGEPYVAERLDAQLDEATRQFLADPLRGLRIRTDGRVALSSIFKWFADDFQPVGGVLAFVRTHLDAERAGRLAGVRAEDLTYLDYDWSVNDATRAR